MAGSGFVAAGKVVKAHGLRGELSVRCYADSPQLFQALERVYIKTEGLRPRKHLIRSAREHSGFLLLSLEGVESRQRALELLQTEVWVRRRDLPGGKEALLPADLIGWEVFLADGRFLGVIRDVQTAAGQELWSIEDGQGREVLFPAADELIPELDESAGRAVIDPPPGLLDICRGEP